MMRERERYLYRLQAAKHAAKIQVAQELTQRELVSVGHE